jgi:hypothetical protein
MTRKWLFALILAACGGGTQSAPPPAPVHAEAPPAPPAPPPDPAVAFRQTYSNPSGMWMPAQMTLPQHAETFKKMGVRLDPKTLADPLSAPLAGVVSLGGCTASFVSPDGLIVTNHHCVQGALQQNSTPEHNLVEDGFLAKTREEELPAGPAQRVLVVQAYKDVTTEMRDGLEKITDPVARKEESERRLNRLVAACEKGRPELRCQVSSFLKGGLYQLIEMLEIKDVRLVYVPARSVGDYGGEVDNWHWPRHTGDWSFYRAYVGKDGKPADPGKDNVPFHPAHWIQVTTKGVAPGDFVMVAGYPGRTNRLVPASQLHHDLEWHLPYLVAYLQERYRIAEEHLADGGETAIKATTLKQGVQNALAKWEGVLQGFQLNPDLLAQKDAADRKAKEWAAQPGREQHKAAIERYEAILAEERRTARVDFDRTAAFSDSRLLAAALSFTRWAEERAKKDPDRKPGYQERDLPRARAAQKQFAKSFDPTIDRAATRLAMVRALRLPEAERPWLATLLGAPKGARIDEATIDRTLDAWYQASTLEDVKLRLDLLDNGTTAKLAASKDPFIRAALRVWPIVKAEEKKLDARTGDLLLVMPLYAEALRESMGGALALDANSTLRITYGTVKSLHPGSKDRADWPLTTAAQILAKDTGKPPFNAPQKLLDAIKARRYGPYADPALGGELPVNFMSDLDITGGNSGSPTLNDKGELVGLAFDGNKEGLASDAVFDGKTTRTIHVDARYMIWTMDLLDGADHLIREMGLEPNLD